MSWFFFNISHGENIIHPRAMGDFLCRCWICVPQVEEPGTLCLWLPRGFIRLQRRPQLSWLNCQIRCFLLCAVLSLMFLPLVVPDRWDAGLSCREATADEGMSDSWGGGFFFFGIHFCGANSGNTGGAIRWTHLEIHTPFVFLFYIRIIECGIPWLKQHSPVS